MSLLNLFSPKRDDVHCHSNCSDGVYSPEELVDRARERWLVGLAVTDHDTTRGAERAVAYGAKVWFDVISGIEISAGYPVKNDRGVVKYRPLHILGYGFNTQDIALNDTLQRTVSLREARIREMVQRLNKELLTEWLAPLDIEKLLRLGMERPLSRPDIANELLQLGHVKVFQEAFDRWLVRLNVELVPISVKEAISLIHDAGGIAVLAHPDAKSISLREVSNRDFGQMRAVIEMVRMGLDGIESFGRYQEPKDTRRWQYIADRKGIITTAGSDFHGIEISSAAGDLWSHQAPEPSIPKIRERIAWLKSLESEEI